MDKREFTDGERSTIWGIEQAELDKLQEACIPYCYNPETQRAIVLFDGRRRSSTVIKIFQGNTTPRPIRSKNAIFSYLTQGKEMNDATEIAEFWNNLSYGFGVTWRRITSEYFPSVEIARIILEFKFDTLKKLNTYILNERPELFSELTQRHVYYTKMINDFSSVDQLGEINKSIQEGFSQLIKSKESNIW
ncbi:hypothetical protein IGI39_003011 [Enterococcus sp. AZ135]|uniref:hypothetical protein n=1 Tax=unclassified Enterococcus TaxID=2608891 RepID=UPI003F215C1F